MHHIGNSTRTLLLIISPLESKATTSTWYEETILLSKLTPVCHTPFRNISSMRVRGNMSIEWVHQSHQLPVRVTSHSKCCSSLLWFYPRIAVLRLSRDKPLCSTRGKKRYPVSCPVNRSLGTLSRTEIITSHPCARARYFGP